MMRRRIMWLWVSVLLLPVMSCASTSPYGVVVRNSSRVELNGTQVSYPHFYFDVGVMIPGARAGYGLVTAPIPEKATVEWRTPDGVIHIKHVPVRSVLPAQFSEINFEITEGNEVKVWAKAAS